MLAKIAKREIPHGSEDALQVVDAMVPGGVGWMGL